MIFYGRNVTVEALKSAFPSKKVYLQEQINIDHKVQNILDLAKRNNTPIEYIPRSKLVNLTKSEEHQGVAIESEFNYLKLTSDYLEEDFKSFIYISEATFEHNVGAIIRSAEVSGINGVIIPKDISINATIARTSAGGIFHIPIIQEAIYNCIKKFKKSNYKVFGIERGGSYYFQNDLTGSTLFIIGGEDKSLSDGIRSECDEILEIPQAGKVNSLNMSVAASIVLFERVRQEQNR